MRFGLVILAGVVLAVGIAALAVFRANAPTQSSIDAAVAQTRDGRWQQGLAFAETCPPDMLAACLMQVGQAMKDLPDHRLDENPRRALDALIGIGAIEVGRQQYFDAMPTLERSIALHDRHFSDPLPAVVPAYRLLLIAIAPLGVRHDARGRVVATRALEIADAKLPRFSADRADLLEAIAALHGLRGRWQEAKTHYGELIAVERALARGENARLGMTLLSLGMAELFTGNPAGFEAAYAEGLEFLKRAQSPDYRTAVDLRANFLARVGRCADARVAATAYEQEFHEKPDSVDFWTDGSCHAVH